MKQKEINRLWSLWWGWAEKVAGWLEESDSLEDTGHYAISYDEQIFMELPNILLEIECQTNYELFVFLHGPNKSRVTKSRVKQAITNVCFKTKKGRKVCFPAIRTMPA